MSLTLIVNDKLPRELRRALARRARERSATMNDVAVEILFEHFGLNGWEYSGAPYQKTADRFRLRVPKKLHQRLRREQARTPSSTMRGLVLSILAEQLGTRPIDTGRRPRRRKEA